MPDFYCNVTSCVRKMTGKKVFANYQIEEECPSAKSGICIYKRNEKVEKETKDVGNPEPAKD